MRRLSRHNYQMPKYIPFHTDKDNHSSPFLIFFPQVTFACRSSSSTIQITTQTNNHQNIPRQPITMWLPPSALILLCSLLYPALLTVALLSCLWHKAQKKQRQFNLKNLPAIEDEHPDAEAAARNDHNRRQKPLPKFQVNADTVKSPKPVVHTYEDLARAEQSISVKPRPPDTGIDGDKPKCIRFAGIGHIYFVPEIDPARGAICDDVESNKSADTYGTNTQSSSSDTTDQTTDYVKEKT